jgi:UDP-N-acetylmuramate dehydrogenase
MMAARPLSGRGAGGTGPMLRGRLRHAVPLARHTTWRVGGPAEHCYQPADLRDLSAYLASLPPDEPVLWLGLGSNLLVRDGGIRGSVILTHGVLNGIARVGASGIRVEAGVPCAKVARFCANAGLTGAEFLVGIPGTMGGALAMNAGAFGGETWELVTAVEMLDRGGCITVRSPEQFEIGYRSVQGPAGEWFVAAQLELVPGDARESNAKIKALLQRRAATQPMGLPSCGSVFRNPPGDHAGRLIESCGLKGYHIGGASVSEKHANFIINRGGASAADIEALINHVRDTVERKCGVRLVAEARIVGEPALAPEAAADD